MGAERKSAGTLEDVKVNVKIKLSALWASVMFLFAYVDIMGKYEPGHLEEAIAGPWVIIILVFLMKSDIFYAP